MPALSLRLLAQLASFRLRVKTLAEAALAGLHRASRLGHSVAFAEHKEYAPGDNVRHLDWKVLARTDRYFIKRFEHEARMPLLLLVDASASMGYGALPHSPAASKLHAAQLLAASFAWVANKQHDAVGLCAASAPPRVLPPQVHAQHLARLVDLLENLKAHGNTPLLQALEALSGPLRRRSLLLVFSDLLEQPPQLLPALRRLRQQKHDVALFHLLHDDEVDFPFEENTRFVAMEDGRALVAHPRHLQHSYRQHMRAFLHASQAQCQNAGVDYALVRTDTPLEPLLLRFFVQRKGGRPR